MPALTELVIGVVTHRSANFFRASLVLRGGCWVTCGDQTCRHCAV